MKIGDPVTVRHGYSGRIVVGHVELLTLLEISVDDGHVSPLVLQLRDEGITWARGGTPEVAAALRAVQALDDDPIRSSPLARMIVGTCVYCQRQVSETDSWGPGNSADRYPPRDGKVYHSECRTADAERRFDAKYGC